MTMADVSWEVYRRLRRKSFWLTLAAAGSAGALVLVRWKGAHRGRTYHAPPQPAQSANIAVWRFDNDCRSIAPGKRLRVETGAHAVVHWSADRWHTVHDVPTSYAGSGIHRVELDTEKLPAGSTVLFTFFWPEGNRWEGEDFIVHVEG